MDAVRAGDRRGLGALYDRHASTVYGLALKVLGRQDDAEAVVSDVFYEVWLKPDRFDPQRGSFRGYLLMLARCRAIDRARATSTRAEKTAAAGGEAASEQRAKQETTTPERNALAEERRRLISEAVQRLDRRQRDALLLAYFQGLTHSEIAKRLDTPVGTVKTRIRRGLIALRRSLAKPGDDR